MCVLDVRGLYQWLASRAAESGAVLRLKTHVTGPLLVDGVVAGVVARGVGEIPARLVIDASGTAGVIAREVGLRGSAPRIGAGVEREVFAPDFDQREAYLIVGDDIAPGGYAWAFPRGEGRVRLGVGLVRPASDGDLTALLDRLLDSVPALASCRGSQPIETHAGVMSAYAHGAVPAAAPGLLVVGDAAGHGSTLVGEGIRHAIVSGRLAGEVGAAALAAPGTPKLTALQEFPRRWDDLVGRQMRIGWLLHGKVSEYRDAEWSRALGTVAQMSPGLVMTALAGDLTPRFALRLLARHPLVALREGRRFVAAGMRDPAKGH
jgi:digeranylgeranylglycerophospholipid reductase